MTKIAHISDLHVLEHGHHASTALRRMRLGFLSFGRPLDANDRIFRLTTALRKACLAGADHIVLTGDLTEDGAPGQFEALAEALSESRVSPERVTLVPGNHDAYTDEHAYARALRGCLKDFAPTSARGAVVTYEDLALVAVSTAMTQPLARAAGRIDSEHVEELEELLDSNALAGRAIVFVQHHPPLSTGAMHWVEGLQNAAVEQRWLADNEALHVLHGHMHKREDRIAVRGRQAQIFAAEAVVESEAPVRFYETRAGRLVPLDDFGGTSALLEAA